MKGVRALASGMLVLAAACAAPAISAAQDAGTTTDVTTTTTTGAPAPSTPPSDPAASPADGGGKKPAVTDKPAPSPQSPAAAPAAVASASAASASAPAARKSSSGGVSIANFAFSPASVTVNVGDTVTWTNHDAAPHNATADDGSFATPTLNNGQSASHRFTQPGTFSYICTIHPNMHGTIRVLSSSSGGGGNSGTTARSGSSGSAGTSAPSEASAVASPNAAGNGTTLPMTGMAAGALALVGLALLNCGLIVRAWSNRRTGRERQLTLF
jgi:plastocyanin